MARWLLSERSWLSDQDTEILRFGPWLRLCGWVAPDAFGSLWKIVYLIAHLLAFDFEARLGLHSWGMLSLREMKGGGGALPQEFQCHRVHVHSSRGNCGRPQGPAGDSEEVDQD